MRAFRTKRRFGGWLALFALGLQLTLSFGHIHAEDFQAKDFAAAAGAVTAQSQTAPQNTPDGDDHRGGHDGCAICAVMHLAGTTLLPAPPTIVLPPVATLITLGAADRTALPPVARQPFQARAPPQA